MTMMKIEGRKVGATIIDDESSLKNILHSIVTLMSVARDCNELTHLSRHEMISAAHSTDVLNM